MPGLSAPASRHPVTPRPRACPPRRPSNATGSDKGKEVAPMTIKLLPKVAADGKASKFVGTDPGLGNVADFEGTVIGEIDGRPSQGTFKEE
ncbi:MAG: hypothetical protein FJ271_19810 [Planctomycetes bacterium]|nr:hypothetical protein [Planctomycetota bacterium]